MINDRPDDEWEKTMGHAYVAKDCDSALILAVCSSEQLGVDGELIDLAKQELGERAQTSVKPVEAGAKRNR
jgi:hypothetical protein